MEITFRQRRLKKAFDSERELQKRFGKRMAKKIAMRMAVLRNARTLSMVPTSKPERRHQLDADRDGQFAVDLLHPHRLVFEPSHNPLPRREDGGIDTDRVTAITIVNVIDYHG